MSVRIGTAGWSIPRAIAERFPVGGSGLERYAARFDCAEINSTFYRPHRRSTWERWRDSVPAGFRFSVKLPKAITHERKLVDPATELAQFVEQVAILGERLGAVLVQLPPKLSFDADLATRFFAELRTILPTAIACEPRHASLFDPAANALLHGLGVARVAADPAIVPAAAVPGGSPALAYWRLHGSPQIYRSSYPPEAIGDYAKAMQQAPREPWCIFDNTASSAATGNALALAEALREG